MCVWCVVFLVLHGSDGNNVFLPFHLMALINDNHNELLALAVILMEKMYRIIQN